MEIGVGGMVTKVVVALGVVVIVDLHWKQQGFPSISSRTSCS